MTRLGYQIPNFTYPDTPEAGIFDAVLPNLTLSGLHIIHGLNS